jgi:8-oxo-dGTP diphosphatase
MAVDLTGEAMTSERVPPEVACCILYQADRFLMQLRDNDPKIIYPGYWALFGGHIEPGETPEVAVVREIAEEICYDLGRVEKFGVYADATAVRHVFYAPLTVGLDALCLNEGWDMGLLTLAEIMQGDRYSDIAGQARPISQMHQRMLQEFAVFFESRSR